MSWRRSLRRLLLWWAPAVVLLIAVAVQNEVPTEQLTGDPLSIADAPALTGLVSNVGAVLWFGGAAVALFGAAVSRNAGDVASFRFLLEIGAVTLLLGGDDLFMVHERLGPDVGVDERITLAALGVAVAVVVARHRHLIARSEVVLLAAAVGAGVTSLIFDDETAGLWEDGPKLLAVVAWTAWLVACAWTAVVTARASQGYDSVSSTRT